MHHAEDNVDVAALKVSVSDLLDTPPKYDNMRESRQIKPVRSKLGLNHLKDSSMRALTLQSIASWDITSFFLAYVIGRVKTLFNDYGYILTEATIASLF